MSAIARRWIVSTGELWLPDGSPTSKPDPETEDWVVLAEDYDALADQLCGAVEALRRICEEPCPHQTPEGPRVPMCPDCAEDAWAVLRRLRGQ